MTELAWLWNMNRGIYMTPGREEEWTLSVTHTDEAIDAYVAGLRRDGRGAHHLSTEQALKGGGRGAAPFPACAQLRPLALRNAEATAAGVSWSIETALLSDWIALKVSSASTLLSVEANAGPSFASSLLLTTGATFW